MKILQIIYSLASGGAERFVVDLCNELSLNGNDVYLCALRDDTINNQGFYRNDIADGINYINLQLPVGLRLSNITAIHNVIKQVKPDVVHCHQNLVNYVFPLTLFHKKIKFFYTVHSDAPKEVASRIEYSLRRYFFKNKKINAISISSETTKSFIDFYKISNCFEIVNGRQMPKKSEEFKEISTMFCNLRKLNDLLFVHIGRCATVKNQKMLINTFNRLINEDHKIVLLIIGNGFDNELGKELKSEANKNIHFLGEKHYIADYLLNADAFCLSSLYEGMPITLIESLACGCVPICTPVGGIVNTIKNGVTGFISKSVSEEDYYQSLKEYIENCDLVKKEKLIGYYNEKFSMEKCAKKHIQLYINT